MTSNARNLSKLLGSSTTVPSIRLDPVVNQNISNALTLAEAPPTQGLNDVGDLPLSGNDIGDQAYVASTGRMYIWTGSGWYNIALINNSPAFDSGGTPDAGYALDSYNGSPTIIQLSASDPEEVPVQWSYVVSDSAQYFATIQQDSSVFTITALPTTTIEQYDSAGGTFSITFKASDGVNLATALSEFTITFIAPWPDITQYSFEKNLPTLKALTGNNNGWYNSSVILSYDGTKMYTQNNDGPAYQINLSTPWDIATASLEATFPGEYTANIIIWLSKDGTKVYSILPNPLRIQYRNLSTPNDLRTASAAIFTVTFPAPAPGYGGLFIDEDETRLLVPHRDPTTAGKIYEFLFNTPGDLSGGLTSNSTIIIQNLPNYTGPADNAPSGIFMSPDGTKIYYKDYMYQGNLFQLNLSIPFNLSSASYFGSLILPDNITENYSRQFYIKPDGTKLYYAISNAVGDIHQLTLA